MKPVRTFFLIFISFLSACAPAAPSADPILTPSEDPVASSTTSPVALPLSTATVIPTPIPEILYVDPAQSLGPISPLIYGSNYGPWLLVSVDMLPAAYDSGVTILRFPAGSWGDHNDVKSYQIDQFMTFAQNLGATAIFHVRLLDGTPEQAAEMVRYT